jgi:hypothetical protein
MGYSSFSLSPHLPLREDAAYETPQVDELYVFLMSSVLALPYLGPRIPTLISGET